MKCKSLLSNICLRNLDWNNFQKFYFKVLFLFKFKHKSLFMKVSSKFESKGEIYLYHINMELMFSFGV